MNEEIAKLMLYATADMIRKLNRMGEELPLNWANKCYEIVGKLWVLEYEICEKYQITPIDNERS